MVANVREELHTIAEQLPANATWFDAMDRLRYRWAVAEGRAAADRGEFATDERVREVFEKYGADT